MMDRITQFWVAVLRPGAKTDWNKGRAGASPSSQTPRLSSWRSDSGADVKSHRDGFIRVISWIVFQRLARGTIH